MTLTCCGKNGYHPNKKKKSLKWYKANKRDKDIGIVNVRNMTDRNNSSKNAGINVCETKVPTGTHVMSNRSGKGFQKIRLTKENAQWREENKSTNP